MLRNGTQTPNVKGGPLKPGEVGIVVEFKQERVSSGDSPEDSSANTKLASASLVVLVSAGCELLQITHGHRENAHSRALVTLLVLSYFNLGSSELVTHTTFNVRAPDGSMWWYEELEIALIMCTLCEGGAFSSTNASSCTTAIEWSNDNSMCDSDGNQLCLNSVGRRVEISGNHGQSPLKGFAESAGRRRALGATVGLFLVGELISFVLGESLDSIAEEDTSEAFPDAGNEGDKCHSDVKLDWCNDAIFHPLSDKVFEERNARDVKAKVLYEKIIASEKGEPELSLKSLVERSQVCKSVVKHSLCLAAFPPCDCKSDITACKNSCDLINDCAQDAKGANAGLLCNSCVNYCDKSCCLSSPSAAYDVRDTSKWLLIMLAHATIASFTFTLL